MTNEDGDERRRRQEEAHIIYYLSSNIDLFFTPTNTQDFEDICDGLMHFLID